MLTRKKFAEISPPTTSPAAAFTSRFVETRATVNMNNSSMNSQFRNDSAAMMERRIEISLTAFRRRSRPQIYTGETQIVYRRTRICPRNTPKDTKA